ncbi:hypothetical protein QJS10_CPB15g02160 [Acorus calamus]|uniref:Phytocyanin domain-containing protein n=1 Tax=Acorus calamus TaxID=4465 RepID=A0AAV9D793_ACOCL|nr:hypothetical protein QJS10_CPB15g02160 [Acorus calamus]
MASKQLFAILAIIVPSIALATEYIVGDDQVFNYNKDSHNVFKVSGPQFRACDVPSPNATNSFTTGHDIIPLMTAGNKWYICGKCMM